MLFWSAICYKHGARAAQLRSRRELLNVATPAQVLMDQLVNRPGMFLARTLGNTSPSSVYYLTNDFMNYRLSTKVWQDLLVAGAHIWSMEVLLRFGVNNNFVIFHTPTVPHILAYRQYFLDEYDLKKFNKAHHSEMIFGFTTGRCGFVRNQKRTFLATDITVRTALWFCKRVYKFLNSVKIRFLGHSRHVKRYLNHFRRFQLGKRRVVLHSLWDVTPTPYNGVRQKLRGRKRYRYHKYTFKRFVKIDKVNIPTRKSLTVNRW